MPPLTLEQILARSLRLKPAKATPHLSTTIPASTTRTVGGSNNNTTPTSTFSPSSACTAFPATTSASLRGKEMNSILSEQGTLPPRASPRMDPLPFPTSASTYSQPQTPKVQQEEEEVGRQDFGISTTIIEMENENKNDGTSSSGGVENDRKSNKDRFFHRPPSRSAPSQEDIIRGLEREAREAKERKYWFMASRERRKEAEAAATAAGPNASHTSGRSSSDAGGGGGGHSDLLSFLHTAHRLESWEEGIEAFCRAMPLLPPSLGGGRRSFEEEEESLSPVAPPSVSSLPIPPPLKVLLLCQKDEEKEAERKMTNIKPLPPLSSSYASTKGKGMEETLLNVLLSLCEGAERLAAVERIGGYYGWRFPAVLTRSMEILLKQKYLPPTYPNFSDVIRSWASSGKEERETEYCIKDSEEREKKHHSNPSGTRTPIHADQKKSWQVAIMEVLARTGIPPPFFSVDIFNHILSLSEQRKDCYGALYVIQSMGTNPLQVLPTASLDVPPDFPSSSISRRKKTLADEEKQVGPFSNSLMIRGVMPPLFPWSSPPVSPNVVSYASLIAALEQAGANRFASYIVSLLPPEEKKEITASYAALIYLWSQQVLTKGRKNMR